MTASRLRACWCEAALLAICAGAIAAPAPTRVVDLLRALSATGVEILYSSDLVPPDLQAPPGGQDAAPMAKAREALAAHHLLLRIVGPKRYVVTRAPAAGASDNAWPSIEARPLRESPQLAELSVFASRDDFTNGAAIDLGSYSRRDLEQLPGAQEDAMRSIRTAPGIATNLSSRPYVRGALRDDVLVRFDGISLTDPFHFKNFQNLISAFDPAAVERVDVNTGGFPVKYGTRSAAVIDLAPRSIDSGYENRVGVSRMSYDLSTVGHAERLPIDWLVTLRHSVHDIVLEPASVDFGEPTYMDAIGRVRWQADADSAFTLGWLLLDDQVRFATEARTEDAEVHDRDVNTWIAVDWAINGALHSRTSVSSTNSRVSRNGSLDLAGVADGHLDEHRDFSTLNMRSDWTYARAAAISWNFGVEIATQNAEQSFVRQEIFAPSIAAAFAQPVDNTLTSHEVPRSATQGFYSSVRRGWEKFEAEVGARIDRQNYPGFGAHAQVSPRLNLSFDPTSIWHAYGSWGMFTQAQSIGEWRSEENQSTPDAANRAVHLIAGVTQQPSAAVRWRLEAYRNDWRSVSPYFDNTLDALSLLPELAPDRVRIAPQDAETQGVELSLSRSFSHGFEAFGAYTWSRATDELNGRNVPRSWDQTHAVSADLAWRHSRTTAAFLVGWHTGWPRTPVSPITGSSLAATTLVLGTRNSTRWGNYVTADLRLAQTLPLSFGDLDLWIDMTNVANRMNECCAEFTPAEQSTESSTIGTKNWLPRIVNMGVNLRFGRSR